MNEEEALTYRNDVAQRMEALCKEIAEAWSYSDLVKTLRAVADAYEGLLDNAANELLEAL